MIPTKTGCVQGDALRKKTGFKVTMFFPLYNNEGNVYGEEVWKWWRERLTVLLQGFTEMGVVNGWWLGHSDQNRWIVAVVRTEKEVGHIRDFLRLACAKFEQKAMYLDYHSVRFEEVT